VCPPPPGGVHAHDGVAPGPLLQVDQAGCCCAPDSTALLTTVLTHQSVAVGDCCGLLQVRVSKVPSCWFTCAAGVGSCQPVLQGWQLARPWTALCVLISCQGPAAKALGGLVQGSHGTVVSDRVYWCDIATGSKHCALLYIPCTLKPPAMLPLMLQMQQQLLLLLLLLVHMPVARGHHSGGPPLSVPADTALSAIRACGGLGGGLGEQGLQKLLVAHSGRRGGLPCLGCQYWGHRWSS
jgi:hypothetical protein